MTVYQDYKYIMQDVGNIYLGVSIKVAKYAGEDKVDLIENEDIPFKLKMIVEKHIKPTVDADTTLESHMYYLKNEGFLYQILCQLKIKIKFNYIEQKTNLFGKKREYYKMKTLKLEDFIKISSEEKEKQGVVKTAAHQGNDTHDQGDEANDHIVDVMIDFDLTDSHTFSLRFLPRKPVGRTSRMMIRMENSMASV